MTPKFNFSPALPLAQWPTDQRQRIVGVLTDIDDTLTEHGDIMPQALDSLERLRSLGKEVIAVTGRPSGWSADKARHWPLRGIVAENGALAVWRNPSGALDKIWIQSAAQRRDNAHRLQAAAHDVLQQMPQAKLASDSAGRETDIAIDHAEHHHLTAAEIEQVCGILQRHQLIVTVSSIHINAWVGNHDKWVGSCWAVRQWLGRDLSAEIAQWVYIGDSANDQIMFRHCPHSVAVSNIAPYWDKLQHHPRYVTAGARGQGFAELTQALCP